jgi:hypothetical protein
VNINANIIEDLSLTCCGAVRVLQDLLHKDLKVKCNKQPFVVNSLTVLFNQTQRKD